MMKYCQEKMKFFWNPMPKGIMVNTLSQTLQNYWQCMRHLAYGVSRQEKTSEWIAVKLVKWESKSLTHFSTTKYCNTIHSIFCHDFCPNLIYIWMTTNILVEMKRERLPITSCRPFRFSLMCTWLSTIANPTFAIFHLFLIFKIKH